MDRRPQSSHLLLRTSPKGHSFIGTCSLCGKENLTLSDLNDECENVRDLSREQALREAIVGPAAHS